MWKLSQHNMEERFISDNFSYMLIIWGTGCNFLRTRFYINIVDVSNRLLNLIAVDNENWYHHWLVNIADRTKWKIRQTRWRAPYLCRYAIYLCNIRDECVHMQLVHILLTCDIKLFLLTCILFIFKCKIDMLTWI